MIPVFVTTYARTQPTLDRTIESLKNAQFTQITISQGTGHPRNDWARAAGAAVDAQDARGSVLIVQDDILVVRGLASVLDGLVWPREVGCVSLYTPDKYGNRPHWFKADDKFTWGACALLFPIRTLHLLLCAESFREHPTDRQIDSAIGHTLFDYGLEFWYAYPSLVQHVGHTSTLGEFEATGWRQASSFPGEDSTSWEFKLPWA